MPGNVNISGALYQIDTGSLKVGPFTMASTTVTPRINLVNVLTTYTAINVGTYVGAVVIPPTTNTHEFVLAGDPGDVGIIMSTNLPFLLTFGADQIGGNIYLKVGTTAANVQIIWF